MKTLPFSLGLAWASEQQLAKSFAAIARKQSNEFEILQSCTLFAQWSEDHLQKLKVFTKRHGSFPNPDPARVRRSLFHGPRIGGFGLLRDLQDLLLLTHQARTAWTALAQAAREMKEPDMIDTVQECADRTDRQIDWLCTRIKVAAPQALTVPVDLAEESRDLAAKMAIKLLLGALLVAAIGRAIMKRKA